MKMTPTVMSRCASGAPPVARARPTGTPLTPASRTPAHCIRRSSAMSRSAPSGSSRVTRHAKVAMAIPDNTAAVSSTRAVSVTTALYTWASVRAVDLIRQKRDGQPLDAAAIQAFVAGVTDGSWPDYQISALLMAIVLRGMTPDEAAVLTGAMVRSGARLDLASFGTGVVDKHSTAGVGDKASLVL